MHSVIDERPILRAGQRRLGVLASCWSWLVRCRERRRQRHALAALDERLLRDIGLSRMQAGVETCKPFWKK